MIPMVKRIEDTEAAAETSNKQEKEAKKEEETMNLNQNMTNLQKEEEDNISLIITQTNIMTGTEVEVTLETEIALEETVMIKETPEVGVEKILAEAEATPLIIEALPQTEEEIKLKKEKATIATTTEKTALGITPGKVIMKSLHLTQEADHKAEKTDIDLLLEDQTKDQTPEEDQVDLTREKIRIDQAPGDQAQTIDITNNAIYVDSVTENQKEIAQITAKMKDISELAQSVNKG